MKNLRQIGLMTLIAVFATASVLCCCVPKAQASKVMACHKHAKSQTPSSDQPCCTKLLKSINISETPLQFIELSLNDFYQIVETSFVPTERHSLLFFYDTSPPQDTPTYLKNHTLRL